MRIVVAIFLSFSFLWSIEIDIEALKRDIQKDSTNIAARIVLARNYVSQGNFVDAQKLLTEVLKIDNRHPKAILFKKDIKKLKQISVLIQSDNLIKSSKVTSYFDTLFNINDYESVIMMFEVMQRNNIALENDAYITVSNSYIKLGKYDAALRSVSESSLPVLDIYFIKAKVEERKGNSLKAEYFYKKALNKRDRVDIVVGLYNFYIKQQQKNDAKDLIEKYQSLGLKNPIYVELKKVEQDVLFSRADRLEDIYKKSNQYSDFKEYYYELEGIGFKRKAFDKLKKFAEKNPQNEEAVLFLAKKYYWKKQPRKSLKIMNQVIKNTSNKDILTLYSNILIELGKKSYKSKQNYYQSSKQKAEDLYFKKEYMKSLKFYIKYFKNNPDDNEARFHLADTLEKLKLYPQAENQYRLVAKNRDKLFTLSLYRFSRVLMAQRDDIKWDKARVVLTKLIEILEAKEPSKQRDNLLRYAKQDLKIVNKPMPKPTKHKDIMLTEAQKKILDEPTLDGVKMSKMDISSVESMIGLSNTSASKVKKLDTTLFGYFIDDDSIQNYEFGVRFGNVVKVGNGSFGFELKRSRFEGNSNNKTKQYEIEVDSAIVNYDRDKLSFSFGLNNFEDITNIMTNVKYHQSVLNHSLTYGVGYQNGIFTNGIPCMVTNDINVISLSLYDLILLKDLQLAEFSTTVNRFSDKNININSSINYPVYKVVKGDFENIFALAGNYEYNTKDDTCYGFSEFFDGNYIQMKSKYSFTESSFIQGIGSLGYSVNSSELLYSYGFLLQIISDKSFDISVDCRHFQSGYSPDGANECYASITHVW
jgi:tetratricopeptide (TPR) repeat protein